MRSALRTKVGLPFTHGVRALRLVWEAAHGYTAAWGMLLVVQGLLPAVSVVLTKLLVDSIVAAAAAGGTWPTVSPLLVYAGLMAAILLAMQLLQPLLAWLRMAQAERVADHIRGRIHHKAVELDLGFFESPEYHDQLHRVLQDAGGRPLTLLENTGSVVQHTVTLVGMMAVLIPYGPWLPAVLVLTTLPVLGIIVRHNRKHHAWWEARTQSMRRASYFDGLLTHVAAAAELRLFGLGDRFMAAYQDERRVLRTERLALEKEQLWARAGAALVALFATGAVLAWLGWRTVQGVMTLGDLALFYQVFSQGQNLMRGLLGGAGQLVSNSLFLHHLFRFLDAQPRVSAPADALPPPAALRQGIRLRNVTFTYPGTVHPALRQFSLDIPAGQTTAIVGENGAGKSTLIKLLSRFYDPDEGTITFDGVDLRGMAPEAVRQMLTVLFQFPVHYQFSPSESIALGDPAAAADPTRIEAAARAAGIHDRVLRLPQGYETPLGRSFENGQELSGGEWQRMAMARAFFREAPIIVLDEPTSMMDSWAEADWFDRVKTLAAGRTVLIITHRFTIARRADVIHVLHQGRVAESGTHEALLAADGLYRASWVEQVGQTTPASSPGALLSSQRYSSQR